MDKMHEKDPQNRESEPDTSVAATATNGLDAPVRPPAPASASTRGGQESDIHQRLEVQSGEIERLAGELRRHRETTQNMEVSIVSRIADVDDDRRHAATRLQRTLQAQREEIDQRLRRQTALVLILLFLSLLLVAGSLTFFYFKLDHSRNLLAGQMSGIKNALDRIEIPDIPTQDPLTREKLTRLSEAVQEISASLERFGEDGAPSPPTTREETQPPLTAPREEKAVALPAPAAPPKSEPATITPPPARTPPPSEPTSAPESSAPGARTQETPASGDSTEARESAVTAKSVRTSPGASDREASWTIEPLLVGDKPFTLQLMGFYSLESLQGFAARHHLPPDYFFQEETYQGRPWFVLIHSLHESQNAAQAAADKLSPDLAKLDIWIRKLETGDEIFRVHKIGN